MNTATIKLDQSNEAIEIGLTREIHNAVKKYTTISVPYRPYTLLPLHFTTTLTIYDIHEIIDNLLSIENYQCKIEFEAWQSIYYVLFPDTNVLQINIYYEKERVNKNKNGHYIIEFQKNNVDGFMVNKIFRAVKVAVEKQDWIRICSEWI